MTDERLTEAGKSGATPHRLADDALSLAERTRCANIALGEKVDADATGEEEDRAYNRACEDIAARIWSAE
jgi:hypothetical protein